MSRNIPGQIPPGQRWLLIDRLIHVFHHELTQNPARPAACNLIEGRLSEVEAFLNALTYGEGSTPAARDEFAAFQKKIVLRDAYFRAIREASLRRKGGRREGD